MSMQNINNQIVACEVCGSEDLRSVIDLGMHPMCDDLVAVDDTRVCKEYPIEIMYCGKCRTAHQRFQIPKTELFPPNYHYRARHTADVLNGMRELVDACAERFDSLKGKFVLDIGCNDGSLLSIFCEKGAKTFGIEPTDAFLDAKASGHQVMNAFMTEAVASEFVTMYGKPDIITFTNVFAHIEDLPGLLRAVGILVKKDTLLVIENHYLGAVLAKNQFDTFYHEHPRTYSYTSFTYIADTLGLNIVKVEFPKRYGGNVRVIMQSTPQSTGHDQWEQVNSIEQSFADDLGKLKDRVATWRKTKGAQIQDLVKQYGRLPAKAFPGRSAIPIKLLGLTEEHISAVYEKSASGKIGHYVPGTRIPILSDDQFLPSSVPLLNLAWHIAPEIRNYMSSSGFKGEIVDIIDFDSP